MQPETSFLWDYRVDAKDRNVLDHEVAFNQALQKARAAGRPFFINCNVNDPHRPFYGSRPAAEKDHNDQGPYGIAYPIGPDAVEVPPFLEDLPDIRLELSQYWNSVRRADIAIGRVLRALDDSGEADNTVVIFCNDHGMPFPYSKATCYDHGTRVAAMVRYPGMGTPRRHEALVSNVDIMPTALELLGLPVPDGLDGRSWVPHMRGENAHAREFLFMQVNGVDNGTVYATRAITDHRYLLIYQPWSDGQRQLAVDSMSGLTLAAMRRAAKADAKIADRVKNYVYGVPACFFDLQTDPGQRSNLYYDSAHQPRIARMRDALLGEMATTTDPQLDNVRTMIAGGTPIVIQPPMVGRQYLLPVQRHGPPRPPGLA